MTALDLGDHLLLWLARGLATAAFSWAAVLVAMIVAAHLWEMGR